MAQNRKTRSGEKEIIGRMAENEHNWTVSPVRRRTCTHCGESLNGTAWDMARHWAREHDETENGMAALQLLARASFSDQLRGK